MFRVVYNQNKKSKVKVGNFHIFLTASGEGRGGSTQAVSLTAFSQFFFLTLPLTPLKMKEKAKHIVYIFIWHVVKYCVSRIFPSVDDEKVCSKGGEDKGGVGEESNPPNPPGMV